MKKFGFTLAEVLITLGIIGVVAAVTMPTLTMNTRYKELGTRFQKFHTNMENAARAYVAANGEFNTDINKNGKNKGNTVTTEQLKDFYNSSLKFKATYTAANGQTSDNILLPNTSGGLVYMNYELSDEHNANINYGVFSDGSAISYDPAWITPHPDQGDSWSIRAYNDLFKGHSQEKYGTIVGYFDYFPNVKGLPKNTRRAHDFIITSKGFIYPWVDKCAFYAYKNNWKFDPAWFKSGGNCYIYPSTQTWE